MGLVNHGIPASITLKLAGIVGATTFIETGTFRGDTAAWAAEHFKTVHTIERAEQIFYEHSTRLLQLPGVKPHLGDSRDVLPTIVKKLGAEAAVYWLDGHYSGGPTAGQDDECPLMDELACVANRPGDIVLIDDARLFLCAPPVPHDAAQWPGLDEIIHALCTGATPRMVQVIDDVIFAVPRNSPACKCLVDYAQARSQACWENFAKLNRTPGKRVQKFMQKLAGKS